MNEAFFMPFYAKKSPSKLMKGLLRAFNPVFIEQIVSERSQCFYLPLRNKFQV
jgi:hypothetical protein